MPSFKRILLAKRAQGTPTADNFRFETVDSYPKLDDGQILVKALVVSVDPYIRGVIGDSASKTFIEKPLNVGDVVSGASVGVVLESRSPKWKVGDHVHAYAGWQEVYAIDGDSVTKVDTKLNSNLEKWVGVLGMVGLTAFYGVHKVLKPEKGQTVVVSGAAGAVGSLVAQIVKNVFGCKVVGIAGSQAKLDYLVKDLGLDAAINYREEKDIGAALDRVAPEGVDRFWDNVGGPIGDAVLERVRKFARIAVCGQISQYNSDDPVLGPRLLHKVLWERVTIQGFLFADYAAEDDETLKQLSKLLEDGTIASKEDISDGFDSIPDAFLSLFTGSNFGKTVVRVAAHSKE